MSINAEQYLAEIEKRDAEIRVLRELLAEFAEKITALNLACDELEREIEAMNEQQAGEYL